MAPEKTRLKFRVSAHDGVSAGGFPAPHWSEKWGVGLFDYEEFHVTDQLLKLPFQEATPKTVCIFSIAQGSLAFRLVDPDRRSEVNGVTRSNAILGVGDRIKIGETLQIEIVQAPPKSTGQSPALSGAAPEAPKAEGEEGPTLTLTLGPGGAAEPPRAKAAAPKREAPPIAVESPAAAPIPIEELATRVAIPAPAPMPIDEPTLTSTRNAAPAPVFAEIDDRSLEIEEPSFSPRTRAALASTAGSHTGGRPKSLIEEPKVELADVPHAARDTSLESRSSAIEESEDEAFPARPRVAKRAPKPSLGAKIRAAFGGLFAARPAAAAPARPWNPNGKADPGFTPMRDAAYGGGKNTPKPWIPEAPSPGARVRGRALVFLVAAIGTLMVAVGVFRIQNRVAEFGVGGGAGSGETISKLDRGLPIEVLEDQVRKMRRR